MTDQPKSHFYDYTSKDEAKKDKLKQILEHEGPTREIYVDPIGIVTLPGGVATANKKQDKADTYPKNYIDATLKDMGAKPLSDQQYQKIMQVNDRATNIMDLNRRKQAGTITEAQHQAGVKAALAEARGIIAAGTPKGQPPFGVVASEEGMQKAIESKLAVAQEVVDKALKEAGLEVSENAKIRTPLETMVYNGGSQMIGPKIKAALKKVDLAAVENEIRNNSNGGNAAPEVKAGLHNRRGKEANAFREGIIEEFRHPPVLPKMPYTDPSVAKAFEEQERAKPTASSVNKPMPAAQPAVPAVVTVKDGQQRPDVLTPAVPVQKLLPQQKPLQPKAEAPQSNIIKPMFAPQQRYPKSDIFPMDRVKENAIKLGGKLLEGMAKGASQVAPVTPPAPTEPQHYTLRLGAQLGQKIGSIIDGSWVDRVKIQPIVFNPHAKSEPQGLRLPEDHTTTTHPQDVPLTSILGSIINYFRAKRG